MTVKLLLLKSGEDIIADVKELLVEEKNVGYLLNTPYIAKIVDGDVTDENQTKIAKKVSVTFYPYIPLTDQKEIPIPLDWVVTIVEPVGQLKEMYKNRISEKLKHEKEKENDEIVSIDEQSDPDKSD